MWECKHTTINKYQTLQDEWDFRECSRWHWFLLWLVDKSVNNALPVWKCCVPVVTYLSTKRRLLVISGRCLWARLDLIRLSSIAPSLGSCRTASTAKKQNTQRINSYRRKTHWEIKYTRWKPADVRDVHYFPKQINAVWKEKIKQSPLVDLYKEIRFLPSFTDR